MESRRLGAQDRSQKSETSASSMDGAANAPPFPFFKLPPELRNKIYHLVVATGRNVVIQSMHRHEFEKSQDNGTYKFRSTYLATDHECHLNLSNKFPYGTIRSCLIKDSRFTPMKTTYTLLRPRSIASTTAMLSLSKGSREEVASIFYGENTFLFTAMSSLIPFMKDRTSESRKYIQDLELTLTVDDRDWDAIFTEYSRPACWNTAFSTLVKLPHVNVKKLYVKVDDRRAQLLKDGINLRSRSMLWLHKLSKIENLDMLGVGYDVGEWRTSPSFPGWSVSEDKEEVNTQTEQELWQFLAPKMLKKEADDHSPYALQKRRLWTLLDDIGNCVSYTDLHLIGNSETESDSEQ